MRSQQGGWSAQLVLAGKPCRCVATDGSQPGRAYCGTADDGLWCTDDGGTSWHRVGDGISNPHVTAVAVGPSQSGSTGAVVYAGTEPSAIFCSNDGGHHWEALDGLLDMPSASTWSFPPRPETHHARWIALDPLEPRRLFVAIEAGALVRSEDGGRTWTDRTSGSPLDTHTLVVHRLDPSRLYSAAGDGYFESRDGGTTWQKPENGLRHRYVWACVVDPDEPNTVLVSASRSAMMAHSVRQAESWIYRTRSGGPWEPVHEGLPQPQGTTISALAMDETDRVVYAANNRGVFRSATMGDTWERLDIPWPERFGRQRVNGLALDR